MTTQSQIPLKWYVPFANGDTSRVELPVTTADPTRASQTLGFPPLTMQPPESGGVPPQGEDFNGGMNQVARVAWWVLLGGGWTYDATFATNSNIGGYPNGAVLQSADFKGNWISIADNNQNNPDTGSGTAWVPGFQYGSTAIAGLTGGTVTLTPAQAAKNSITLAGTLGSALTIILPTWVKNWTITNNTTGAFVTIVKTAAGSGITIPQNGAPTRVGGDGTNITQVAENVPAATSTTQAARFSQTFGRLLNVQVFTASGTYTQTPGTTSQLIQAIGGGGSGSGTPATGASQVAVGGPGGSGAYAEVYFSTPVASGTAITIGAGGAQVNGGSNPGTSTTVGSAITCPGGRGGSTAGPTTAPVLTGSGAGALGTATQSGGTALVLTQGNSGGLSFAMATGTTAIGGAPGADGQWGGGGIVTAGNTPGNQGTAPGAGGSGTATNPSQASIAGGPGFRGVVIIYEFGSV